MITASMSRGRHSFWVFVPLSGTARTTPFSSTVLWLHPTPSLTLEATGWMTQKCDASISRHSHWRRGRAFLRLGGRASLIVLGFPDRQFRNMLLMRMLMWMINVCSLFLELRDLGDWNTPKVSSPLLSPYWAGVGGRTGDSDSDYHRISLRVLYLPLTPHHSSSIIHFVADPMQTPTRYWHFRLMAGRGVFLRILDASGLLPWDKCPSFPCFRISRPNCRRCPPRSSCGCWA